LGEKIRAACNPAHDYYIEMQDQINKPIFVVGSPRSGTSILAWCLGHHPNLFPVPESSWMGEFAISVATTYQTGAARGDYSILSAMDVRDHELFIAFGQSINDLIPRHRKDLETKRETSTNKCARCRVGRALDAQFPSCDRHSSGAQRGGGLSILATNGQRMPHG
jgi:hypothetical protein